MEGKVKEEQIGEMGDYPITVTSIGYLFLFRVVGLGETSPVTWGFEKAKGKGQGKSFPLTSHHRSESPAKQPIKDNNNQICTCPEQSNIKTIFARSLAG